MLKKLLALTFFLLTFILQAQIVGKVTDTKGEPLPFVNIYFQDSYTGTTSNDAGNYELSVSEKKEYTVVFQYLGYTTQVKKINISSFPHILNVSLVEESFSLDEVVLTKGEDPAYRIIRETVARRKENLEKMSAYTADFYSRGVWRVKDIPKKILGQEVGDFDGALDSTRTGIIYLSETISEIAYQKPDDFKEKVIASKVSGNDNGFSFNSAREANFSFYDNTIDLFSAIVSPIGSNALSYYNYKLDGVFYEGSKLINKIKVIPKRPLDRVFSGFIYIVEDDWQLYGTELNVTGQAMQLPFIESLLFKQNFKYDSQNDFWVKISQNIDFGFGIFGVNGKGRFIAIYSNYDFKPNFERNSFTNEVQSFAPQANKKDSLFWKGTRPVALTDEEFKDYIRKDSIQQLRKSKTYLDSIDAKGNKFKVLDILTGYSYRNSYKNWRISYDAPLTDIRFNTVQGWNSKAGISYYKSEDDRQLRWVSASLNATYGIAEDRVRFTGGITRSFNRTNNLRLSLTGGSVVSQFNAANPISPLINTVSTLFFERNFMKVYDLDFAKISYSQEVLNGLRLYANAGYEKRKPLFNNTDYVTINNENVTYTSNNPLAPSDFENAAIEEHDIIKSQLTARVVFGQKYVTNPDAKFNIGNDTYPELLLGFENGLGASNSNYNYSEIRAGLYQSLQLGNKGQFIYRLKGGTFINGDDISFVDYRHFNGNQTRIGTAGNYTNVYNLLPYYQLSTNKSYFEGHLEHDFKGYILGKIPGINKLNFNLVAGAHLLSTQTNTPYTEVSLGIDNIGFGKYRLLRLDYVKSYFDGGSKGAFIFGLKFINIIE